MVDRGSYPKGVKGYDARNIPFEILFSLGLPVNCPSSEPSEKTWNLRAGFTDAGPHRLNK
jgi:hypothetical protein